MSRWLSPTVERRFWSKVDVGAPQECWPWTAATINSGYGHMQVGTRLCPRKELAHRIAWRLTRGPVPDELRVLHRCDNRLCCNPAHLFLGTDRDNSLDMVRKGRGRGQFPPGRNTHTRPEVVAT